ncbi:hypothetical protein [Mucilaginibacter gracilis]|nr:hypothetical protein [Mucilaginibacter gracilis]
MKSHLLIPVAMLGIFLISNHAKGQAAGPALKKAPASVTIDGLVSDWKDTPPVFDGKFKLSYTIANDDTSLYLIVLTGDPMVKRKITKAGITVSINTEGKKRKTYSVTFPKPGSSGFRRNADNTGSFIPGTIQTSGFKGVNPDEIPPTNGVGFKAAFKFDDERNLGYEMAIPLRLLALKADKSNDIFINVCINGIDGDKSAGGISASASTGAVNHTGRDGGKKSDSGNSNGGGGADDPDMSESQDFWLRFTLAH